MSTPTEAIMPFTIMALRHVMSNNLWTMVEPTEPELAGYLVAVNGDRTIIVAPTGYTFPGTFKRPVDKQMRKAEPNSVRGLDATQTEKFDVVLAMFPDYEGFLGCVVRYGSHGKSAVMIAPVDGIREHPATRPGGPFSLGAGESLLWNFRQSSPIIGGCMTDDLSANTDFGD